jgi:hypothetical protein
LNDIRKCADGAFGIFSPAFAATKAEKAFGFRFIRVYLRWACAIRNLSSANQALVLWEKR